MADIRKLANELSTTLELLPPSLEEWEQDKAISEILCGSKMQEDVPPYREHQSPYAMINYVGTTYELQESQNCGRKHEKQLKLKLGICCRTN